MKNTLNSQEKGKLLSSYPENTLLFRRLSLAKKLDNSIQIVKITGHVLDGGKLSQVGARVTLTFR